MVIQEPEKIFEKASKINKKSNHYRKPEEWDFLRRRNGAKRLKRKAIGFFRNTTIRSLDDMTQIFIKIGMASSAKEGREIMQSLVGNEILYAPYRTIEITKVINENSSEERYKIFAYHHGDGMG